MKYLLGLILVAFAVSVLGVTFLPLLFQELSYDLRETPSASVSAGLVPIDTGFGIVIPKIGANAHVIKDVDPFNDKEYQSALSRGVAHAKGTALPGQPGNIFLFSHSSADFLNATKYNSIFYLLTKLEKDDSINLFYDGKEYVYQVRSKKIVEANALHYLTDGSQKETLTLMTCWPPGTSLKRLVVQAIRLLVP